MHSGASRKILLVEDDKATAEYIAKGLEESGYSVDRAEDGLDGLAVLAALRAAGVGTPVLILSARASIDDRVEGLTAGSDDYLVKPFAFSELLARVTALQRRVQASSGPVITELTCGDLKMDLLAHRVERGGTRIELQPREYRLLEF